VIDNLQYVTLSECLSELLKCDNYGWGLDVRRIAKGLKVIDATVQRHKESYDFWLDMYTVKLLKNEGIHAPLYVIEPRWEQEILYAYWIAYFSYSWRGAKADLSERKYQE
jgi:hypothetical protein